MGNEKCTEKTLRDSITWETWAENGGREGVDGIEVTWFQCQAFLTTVMNPWIS
jgi:hypothetical protein